MTTSAKSAFPAGMFDPWTRTPVDQTAGGDFDRIHNAATTAAVGLLVGGGVRYPASPYEIAEASLREGLLYLLELGLVDIDAERLDGFWTRPHPPYREGR